MKFAIGTAQFKHGYGILNNHINVRDAISVIKTKKKISISSILLHHMEVKNIYQSI